MARNLLARLRKNEDTDSVHELVEDFIIGGLTLDLLETAREKYQNVKQKVYHLFYK